MRDETLREHLTAYRASHDPARIAALFEATAPRLWQLAMHLARDPADADDLLQRTYLAIIENAERYDPEQSAMGWMMGILTNKARDQRRRAGRQTDPDRLFERLPATPAEVVQSEEEKTILGEAVGSLPDLYRQVVELVLDKGIGPSEVAQRLDRTPGAVRVQLHRAVALLRRALPPGMALPAVLISIQSAGLEAVRQTIHHAALKHAAGAAGSGATASKVAALALGLGALGLGTWTSLELSAGPRDSTLEVPLEPPGAGPIAGVETGTRENGAAGRDTGPALETPASPAARSSGGSTDGGQPAPAPAPLLGTVFQVQLEGGEGFSFADLSVVPVAQADISFDRWVMGVQAHGAVRVAAFPEDHPRVDPQRSSHCLLRSTIAIDPHALLWAEQIELSWPEPERNVFLVACETGYAVVARVNWRWNPERKVTESLVFGIYNSSDPRFAGHDGVQHGGVRIDPRAFEDDPFAALIETRRQTQVDKLDARVARLAGNARPPLAGQPARVRGVLALPHAYSVRYDSCNRVGATFSFEHDARGEHHPEQGGAEGASGDPDLVYDENGELDFCPLLDDRSRAWKIGRGASLLPLPQNLEKGVSKLDSLREDDLIIVHTIDPDSDRWDVLRLLELDREHWLIFEWIPLEDRAWIESYQAAVANARNRIRGDRMRVKMRVDSHNGGLYRAFLDETVNAFVGRTAGPMRSEELSKKRKPKVHIDGGEVPPGKVFEVELVEWRAKAGPGGDRSLAALGYLLEAGEDGEPELPVLRVVVRGEQIVDTGGPDMPKRGRWEGRLALGAGDTSSAYVEVRGAIDCEVEFHGTWRDARPDER